MEKKNIPLSRWLSYLAGIFIMNTGIALTIRAGVGLSPISSLTRVMTVVYPLLTQGTYSFLLNFVMFFGEFVVLPKDFRLKNFTQLIPAMISGIFLDANLYLFSFLTVENYVLRLCLLVLGCAVLALGLYLMIEADLILMPADAFNSVVVKRTRMKWGNVKSMVDCGLLVISAVIGLVFLGKIMFIREGTLINAIICGQFIKMHTWIFNHLKKSVPEAVVN